MKNSNKDTTTCALHGGGWSGDARYLRSAFRFHGQPGYRSYDFGFRLASRTKK